ncbi:MAG: hypothetical protein RL299_862 [Pseudomonadota bacterium]
MTPRSLSLALGALALALPLSVQAGNGRGPDHSQHGPQGHNPSGNGPKAAKIKRAKACPPGLAKKNTGCLPPGQWKKGDQLPAEWAAQFIRYGSLPDFFRTRYDLDPSRRYLYRDDRVFVVDAVTRTVLDIVTR